MTASNYGTSLLVFETDTRGCGIDHLRESPPQTCALLPALNLRRAADLNYVKALLAGRGNGRAQRVAALGEAGGEEITRCEEVPAALRVAESNSDTGQVRPYHHLSPPQLVACLHRHRLPIGGHPRLSAAWRAGGARTSRWLRPQGKAR